MNLKLTKIYFSVQDYLMILFGTFIIRIRIQRLYPFQRDRDRWGKWYLCVDLLCLQWLIPVSVSYFVINVALLVVALKILGLKFLIKTIFGVFSLSASLSLFEWLLKGQPILHDQPFMAINNRSVHVWCRTRIGILGER